MFVFVVVILFEDVDVDCSSHNNIAQLLAPDASKSQHLWDFQGRVYHEYPGSGPRYL